MDVATIEPPIGTEIAYFKEMPDNLAPPPISNSSSDSLSDEDDIQTLKDSMEATAAAAYEMDSLDIIKLDTSAPDPKTLHDYLSVAAVITSLPGFMFYDSVTNALSGESKRRPFRDALLDSMMGRCYRSSTLPQLRIMCGKRSLQSELRNPLYRLSGAPGLPGYNTEFKASGCAARWICEVPDRQPEDPVLLYFHGGGYALKTCQPQIDYIGRIAKKLRLKFPRLSVLVLDYTISPFAKYPVQRNQAVSCVRALQKTCSNIVLIGDSCGGNLALSMLLEESQIEYNKLLGCMLISPWVDLASQDGSMNSRRDILSKRRLNEMMKQFVTEDQLSDPRVSPILADSTVWRRVLPRNTACVWGSFECLADQVAQFKEVAQISNFYLEQKGTHDCILRGLKPKPCKYISEQLSSWLEHAPNS